MIQDSSIKRGNTWWMKTCLRMVSEKSCFVCVDQCIININKKSVTDIKPRTWTDDKEGSRGYSQTFSQGMGWTMASKQDQRLRPQNGDKTRTHTMTVCLQKPSWYSCRSCRESFWKWASVAQLTHLHVDSHVTKSVESNWRCCAYRQSHAKQHIYIYI